MNRAYNTADIIIYSSHVSTDVKFSFLLAKLYAANVSISIISSIQYFYFEMDLRIITVLYI